MVDTKTIIVSQQSTHSFDAFLYAIFVPFTRIPNASHQSGPTRDAHRGGESSRFRCRRWVRENGATSNHGISNSHTLQQIIFVQTMSKARD